MTQDAEIQSLRATVYTLAGDCIKKDKQISLMQEEVGLLTIERDQAKRLRESCESALAERNQTIESHAKEIEKLKAMADVDKTHREHCNEVISQLKEALTIAKDHMRDCTYSPQDLTNEENERFRKLLQTIDTFLQEPKQ